MGSKDPINKTDAKHRPMDTELDRAPREPKGARTAGERDSPAAGVKTGAIQPGKTGGANLA